jgi:hypothetical protein
LGGSADRKAATTRTKQKQNKRRYPGFEPTVPVFEQTKIFVVVDRATTVNGMDSFSRRNCLFILELQQINKYVIYINLIQNEGFMSVLQVIAFMCYTKLPNQLARMLVVVQLVQNFSTLLEHEV